VESEERLLALYEAFNARDIEAVLARLHPDVEWPNAWEGGRLHGRAAVRDYWSRQWAEIDPTVDPTAITALGDGSFAVDVRQVVRDRDGNLLAETDVRHVYAFRDGLVVRMDVLEEGEHGGA
jgi:hypothetical protein